MAKEITVGGQQGGADNTITTYQDLGTYVRLDRMEALLGKTIEAVDALTKQTSYSIDSMKSTMIDIVKNTLQSMNITMVSKLDEIHNSLVDIAGSMFAQEQEMVHKLNAMMGCLTALQSLSTSIVGKDNKDIIVPLTTMVSKIDSMMELQKQLIGATNQLASNTVTSINSVANVIAQSEDKAATSMITELKALKDTVVSINTTMKEAYRLK